MEKVKISAIKANSKNPRVIKDDKFKKLVKSIHDFPEMLEKRPLVCFTDVDGKYVVLGGNMRLKAAQEVGLKELPIVLADDWTQEQRDEFLIKDNVGFGEWDWDQLANEWDAGKLDEWGLNVPNFNEEVLEAEEDDFDTTLPDEPITVLGDLYEIGEHRLLCGDSTCSDTVAKLMNGEKADMVFTDPPYGISHSGKGITANGVKGNDFGEILNDNDVSVAVDNFNLISYLYPEATLVYWGANYYPECLQNGYGWLFWDKETQGNTFSGGEIAFVNKGIRFDVFRHRWAGFCKASEMGEKRVHPTQKPIELVRFSFENYNAGYLIADFFLGSGSTMVASHQLNRKCYGMELDPKYCDVIVNRMIALDPNIEIKLNGKPFEKAH
jgi:site-specific DNA-methyltransferase (adenine-specific)